MQRGIDTTIDEAIDLAASRLRSVAWAGGVVLIAACWGLAYGISVYLMGVSSPAVFLLSVLGGALMLLVLLDVFVRLHHCQTSEQSDPAWWLLLIDEWPFRPLPSHLIEDGQQLANREVESWLLSLDQEEIYLREEAQALRTAEGHWDRAAAVNLFLLAHWRRRQLLHLAC